MARRPVELKEQWLVKLGLEVSTRDVGTSKVTSVLCLFCKHCGRDDGDDNADGGIRKRKRTTNKKYFTSPWRSDNFSNHLSKQHKTKWEIYQGLQNEEKIHFFTREEKPEAVAMRSFVQPEATMKARILAKQKCIYLVDLDIIEQLFGDLFFDTKAEDCEDDVARTKKLP
jgi:hypothetical protein